MSELLVDDELGGDDAVNEELEELCPRCGFELPYHALDCARPAPLSAEQTRTEGLEALGRVLDLFETGAVRLRTSQWSDLGRDVMRIVSAINDPALDRRRGSAF